MDAGRGSTPPGAGITNGSPSSVSSPYLATPRGPSSQSELAIDWDYPAFKPQVTSGDRAPTVAVFEKRALPLAEAVALIAGEDPRPLLVLRECRTCSGTEDALMTRQADNEKTMLLSRWFHCVKLPPDVLELDHPAHALFPGETPMHLFVASRDGSGRQDLNGQQSRTELWRILEQKIQESYASKHEPVLGELSSLLDDLDALDERIANLKKKLDGVIEEDGPRSSKAAKLQEQIQGLSAERAELRERAVRVSSLKLKPAKSG
jgi:hypothetical protein